MWLPVIISVSIALGIFIGNHYLKLSQGKINPSLAKEKILNRIGPCGKQE